MSAEIELPLRWRIAVALATAAAFVLLAWTAAHWIWRWVSPRPATITVATPADPAATIVASGLWSGGESRPEVAGAPPAADLRLLGVLAERDGKGLGVFRTREGARVVAAGGEIVSGTTLVSVRPSGVTVRDGGGERLVELRRDAAAPRSAPAAPRTDPGARIASAQGRQTSPACAIPAGFSGAVLKLHAELLDGLIAQPDSWRALLAADNGALVVRENGGFASMLGLARGDRITQANGIALQHPDDVTGAVLRPLAANQPVRIAGMRGGQRQDVFVVNASSCP